MQFTWLIIFTGAFFWMLFNLGIETALAFATVLSGIIWAGYALFGGPRPEKTSYAKVPDLPLLVDYAKSFFPIFLVVLLLRTFVAEPFRIPSGSMMPTLLVGDFILVEKYAYGLRLPVTKTKVMDVGEPERGDVVVFQYPMDKKINYIKRLIGVPGDKITYKNKLLYINDKVISQEMIGPYQPVGSGMRAWGSIETTELLGGAAHAALINPRAPDLPPGCDVLRNGPIVVPEGSYFMMGDNRDDSNDGRCWGFVPEANLVGKALVIWLSWDWKRSGYVDWSRIGTKIE